MFFFTELEIEANAKEKALAKLHERLQAREQEVGFMKSQLLIKKEKIKKLKKENEELTSQLNTSKKRALVLTAFYNEYDAKQSKPAEGEAAEAAKCKACALMRVKVGNAQVDIDMKDKKIAQLEEKKKSLERDIQQLKLELQKLNTELSEKQEQINYLNKQVASLHNSLDLVNQKVEAYHEELEAYKKEEVVLPVGEICSATFARMLSFVLSEKERTATARRRWWDYAQLKILLEDIFKDDPQEVAFRLWLFKRLAPQMGLPATEQEQQAVFACMCYATEYRHPKAHTGKDQQLWQLKGFVETFLQELSSSPFIEVPTQESIDSLNAHLDKVPGIYACVATCNTTITLDKWLYLKKFYDERVVKGTIDPDEDEYKLTLPQFNTVQSAAQKMGLFNYNQPPKASLISEQEKRELRKFGQQAAQQAAAMTKHQGYSVSSPEASRESGYQHGGQQDLASGSGYQYGGQQDLPRREDEEMDTRSPKDMGEEVNVQNVSEGMMYDDSPESEVD